MYKYFHGQEADLDARDEGGSGGGVHLAEHVVRALREQRQDGLAGVAADDGYGDALGGGADDVGDEGGGAAAVEGGDAKQAVRVVAARGLEDLARDRHGRVDRVRDDARPRRRAHLDAAGQGFGGGGGAVV